MAPKQPDFRQNPSPTNRGTDEVIGRFQSPSGETPAAQETPAPSMEASTGASAGASRSGGLGRFFRAASERLHLGRSGARRLGGTFGGAGERDEARSFEASGYGEARSGGMEQGRGSGFRTGGSGRERSFRETGDGEGSFVDAGRSARERSFDDMDARYPAASDPTRGAQRRGYPEASYGGDLREDRGLYSDFAGGRGEERSYRQGRELPRSGWQREPLTAQEIMTRSPRSVRRETPLRDAAQIMKDENVGIVPVVDEGGRLVGVLTDRDIVVRAFVEEQRSPVGLRVSEVMTDDVEAVTPEESIHEIIELMGRRQVRRVPVVDRDDRLLGIIAMADIANRAEQDEELQSALERISSRRSFWSRL